MKKKQYCTWHDDVYCLFWINMIPTTMLCNVRRGAEKTEKKTKCKKKKEIWWLSSFFTRWTGDNDEIRKKKVRRLFVTIFAYLFFFWEVSTRKKSVSGLHLGYVFYCHMTQCYLSSVIIICKNTFLFSHYSLA